MADAEVKGKQYLEEARKKLNARAGLLGVLFGWIFRSSSKTGEAIELFVRAANMFKMAKKWTEAGDAFCEAAELRLKLGNKHDSATAYCDASVCYKKGDAQKAVDCLQKAIEIYTDMGRFIIAAKLHMSCAEIYESELVDIGKAISHYEQAADYYEEEESTTFANKCLIPIAKYAAQLEKYQKAIEIYEKVANIYIDSPLLRYSAKEYYFKAALCHMCVDNLNAQLAIKKYEEAHPAFADSRECKLLKVLIEKLDEQDVDGFTEEVAKYDSIVHLDKWLTNILLKIKKTINAEPDLR